MKHLPAAKGIVTQADEYHLSSGRINVMLDAVKVGVSNTFAAGDFELIPKPLLETIPIDVLEDAYREIYSLLSGCVEAPPPEATLFVVLRKRGYGRNVE
jgi:hypothetical protein